MNDLLGSKMQNPSQDCSRQINSSHNQSSYPNSAHGSTTSIDHDEEHGGCYTDDDAPTVRLYAPCHFHMHVQLPVIISYTYIGIK